MPAFEVGPLDTISQVKHVYADLIRRRARQQIDTGTYKDLIYALGNLLGWAKLEKEVEYTAQLDKIEDMLKRAERTR